MSKDYTSAVADSLGGSHEKPKKEISHIVTKKSANGDHIHEHHHKHPGHHPMEEHTTRGDDEMVAHMMQHMGTPNPGEDASAAPDAGAAPADASAGAAPAAGPVAPAAGM